MNKTERRGNLFCIDGDFLLKYSKAVASYVNDPSSANKARLKELHERFKDCLATHTALRTAKSEKERVAINGGKAVRERRKTKQKARSK